MTRKTYRYVREECDFSSLKKGDIFTLLDTEEPRIEDGTVLNRVEEVVDGPGVKCTTVGVLPPVGFEVDLTEVEDRRREGVAMIAAACRHFVILPSEVPSLLDKVEIKET